MTRRSFLRAVAAGVGLVLVGGLRGRRSAFATNVDTALIRSLAELAEGRECRTWSVPFDGWSRERAVDTLSEGLSRSDLDRILSDSTALQRHLDQRAQSDFERGRIQSADGWWLSESEIAAIVLLCEPRP